MRVRGASRVCGACAHRYAQLPRDTLRVALGAGCHRQTSGCLNCRRRMWLNEALRHAPCTPKLHHLKERNWFSLPCDFQVPGACQGQCLALPLRSRLGEQLVCCSCARTTKKSETCAEAAASGTIALRLRARRCLGQRWTLGDRHPKLLHTSPPRRQ